DRTPPCRDELGLTTGRPPLVALRSVHMMSAPLWQLRGLPRRVTHRRPTTNGGAATASTGAGRARALRPGQGRGIVPVTVVPRPGADVTSRVPPMAARRSAMPCRPVP